MSQTLAALLKRQTDAQGPGKASPFATAVDGLILLRSDHERHPSHHIVQPALCVVAQGAKRTTFGGRHYEYGAGQALVVSVEMPALSRVVKASPSEPYLGLAIEFDPAVMRDVLACLDTPRAPAMSHGNVGHGVFVTDFEGPLADCVLRLVRLLDTPKAIPVIAPLIMREICYWLLVGPHGNEVAKVVLANSHAERVVNAIHVLRDQFSETLRIEDAGGHSADEPVGVSSAVQSADVHDAAAIPEAAASARSPPSDGERRHPRGSGRVSRGLRKPLAVQPRIFAHVRRAAPARRRHAQDGLSLCMA